MRSQYTQMAAVPPSLLGDHSKQLGPLLRANPPFFPANLLCAVFTALLLLAAGAGQAQVVLAQYAFNGESLAPSTTNANVTAANINFTGSSASQYISGGFPYLFFNTAGGATSAATAVSSNSFVQFTLTPNSGVTLNLSSLTFKLGGNNAPPPVGQLEGYVVRSSADNYASNLSTGQAGAQFGGLAQVTVSLSAAAFQNRTTAITFRLYGFILPNTYGSSYYAINPAHVFDDVTVNGTAVVPCVNPTVFNVTGGQWYCPGVGGSPFGLDGSEIGVNYQVQNFLQNLGNPVAGTGQALPLGTFTNGQLSVVATRVSGGCTADMNGVRNFGQLFPPDFYIDQVNDNACQVTLTAHEAQNKPLNGSSAPPPPPYLWSTGQTSQSIAVSANATYTVTATDANGCTGTAESAVNMPSGGAGITNITAGGFTSCNGNQSYIGEDDYTLGGITVTFNNIPASGTLDLTCSALIGTASVNVSALSGNSYTFNNLKLRCTGQPVDITAAFSTSTCSLTKPGLITTPQQCSRFVFTGSGNWGVTSNWQNNNMPNQFGGGGFRHITFAGAAVIPSGYSVFSYDDSIFVAANASLAVQNSCSFGKSNSPGVAFVNNGTVMLTGNGAVTLTNMDLYNNGPFTVNGSSSGLYMSGTTANLYNSGTLTNLKGFQSFSNLTNLAGGVIDTRANFYLSSGIFTNAGSFTHNWPGNNLSCYMGIDNSGSFTIETGSSLDVTPYNAGFNDFFTNTGTVTNKGELVFNYSPNITNAAGGTFNNTGTVTTRKGMLQNGTFNNQAGGTLLLTSYSPVFENNGVVTNNGTIAQEDGAIFKNKNLVWQNATMDCTAYNALFENADSLVIGASATMNLSGPSFEFVNTTTGTVVLNGTMNAQNEYSNHFVNNGILKGTGTLDNSTGKTLTNSATGAIVPGASPGTLTIHKLDNQGAINLEIGGYTPGTQHDVLDLATSSTLGGTLNVTLVNGFQPSCGDYFEAIPYLANTGTFSTVNLPTGMSVEYFPTSASLLYAKTEISLGNVGTCNGNNTSCADDDTFTADVTVTFNLKPASGTLSLTGPTIVGTVTPVDVAAIVGNSHTFTGVTLKADGDDVDLTVDFSEGCDYNDDEVYEAPSCSNPSCAVTGMYINNIGNCNDNGTTTASDDYFVSGEVAVIFAYAPSSGNLVLKRGSTVLGTKSAAELACTSEWHFLNVQMAADGLPLDLTAEFTGSSCTLTPNFGFAPASCSCVPPTFTTCPTNKTANTPTNACAAAVSYLAEADGVPASTITYAFTGATTGSNSGTGSGTAFNPGVTNVTLTATNPCGAPTCSFTVTVTDNVSPTIGCPSNKTVAAANPPTCTVVASAATPTYNDNCTPSLSYTITGATTGTGSGSVNGVTFNNGSSVVTYRVSDAANNSAFCSFSVTVTCQMDFSGRIIWKRNNTLGVKDVTVALGGDQATSVVTPVNGNYSITTQPGNNFTITPTKTLNKMNGVNAQDVTRIQQHLGANPITDPYDLVAADVNSNGMISSLDANIIQLALMGNSSALAQFINSWRFVPTAHTMATPPWGFPEKITIASATGNQSGKDFYGIKVGDVATTFANPANAGQGSPLVLSTPDQRLQAGEILTVPVGAAPLADISALQFALRFDPQQLILEGIETLGGLPLTEANFGTYEAENGDLRVVWGTSDQTHTLKQQTPLFQLRFRALESGSLLSEALVLDDEALSGHVYDSRDYESGVSLRFDASTAAHAPLDDAHVQLLQNRPNPFAAQTTIAFVLPEACQAQLRVLDATGRVVTVRSGYYAAGRHEEPFEWKGAAGVLYYELVTPWGVLVRKMEKL